jgi:hypothetical protein
MSREWVGYTDGTVKILTTKMELDVLLKGFMNLLSKVSIMDTRF